jgi:hypothetical protein
MRLWTACALLVLAAACSRPPSSAPVEYAPPDGRFSARLPPVWRVDDSRGEARLAAFFGPGADTQAESIFVSFFPSTSRWKTPREYAYAQATTGRAGPVADDPAAGPGALETTVERTIADAHQGRRVQKVRIVLIPAPDGFFALEDFTDPAREPSASAFDGFVASFRPRR